MIALRSAFLTVLSLSYIHSPAFGMQPIEAKETTGASRPSSDASSHSPTPKGEESEPNFAADPLVFQCIDEGRLYYPKSTFANPICRGSYLGARLQGIVDTEVRRFRSPEQVDGGAIYVDELRSNVKDIFEWLRVGRDPRKFAARDEVHEIAIKWGLTQLASEIEGEIALGADHKRYVLLNSSNPARWVPARVLEVKLSTIKNVETTYARLHDLETERDKADWVDLHDASAIKIPETLWDLLEGVSRLPIRGPEATKSSDATKSLDATQSPEAIQAPKPVKIPERVSLIRLAGPVLQFGIKTLVLDGTSYLKVKDARNNWWPAQVVNRRIEESELSILVHYVGLDYKMNEWIPVKRLTRFKPLLNLEELLDAIQKSPNPDPNFQDEMNLLRDQLKVFIARGYKLLPLDPMNPPKF